MAPGDELTASPVLGVSHRGTLWYADWKAHWAADLRARSPKRLLRLRGEIPGLPPARFWAPPEGFVPAGDSLHLGVFPYSWDSALRTVHLDEFAAVDK
jgi:hypothetical protein